MSTDPEFLAYVCAQVAGAGQISSRRMFGEAALYCDGKVVGLVCGNQLFLKPTDGARALLSEAEMAPPYPGAKPHLLPDAELDDNDLMQQVVRVICAELPAPKPKKPKSKR